MPLHDRALRLLALSLLIIGVTSSAAHAQDDESGPAWTIQSDPLTDALGIANLLVERRVSDNVAIYIGPSLKLYDSLLEDVSADESYRGYGAEFGARWFWSGTAPTGWWTGIRGVLAQVTHDEESSLGGYVSALGGHAWAFDGRWVLSLALGISYFDYSTGGAGVDGVLPGAHTGIGVAF